MIIRRSNRILQKVYQPRMKMFHHCTGNKLEINTREGMYGLYPGDVISIVHNGKDHIVFGSCHPVDSVIILGTHTYQDRKLLVCIRDTEYSSEECWCIHYEIHENINYKFMARYGEKYFDVMRQVSIIDEVIPC